MRQPIPEKIETPRLILRKPELIDALDVFNVYASDAEAVTYMSWPRHTELAHSTQFVQFGVDQWAQNQCGPYLIFEKDSGVLMGSTGLEAETQFRATTGYILSKNQWGKGYATETLRAIVDVARLAQFQRLYAYCHYQHRNSAHVMEKCGFEYEGLMRNHIEFPNLTPGSAADVTLYAWTP